MLDADQTAADATEQVNMLRASSRAKYISGSERLQMGEDALALLSFHGALEDALWAYLIEQGQALGPLLTVLDTLRADPEHPLSDADAALLRGYHQLRSRIAHGEEIALDRSDIASYQQVAWELLRTYRVSVDQHEGTSDPAEREAPRRTERTLPTGSNQSRRRSRREGLRPDLNEWREQAAAQVQRNRQLLIPIAAGVVVFLLLCFVLRALFGGSDTPQTAQQTERPTIGLGAAADEVATPLTVGTSLANEQAEILPTAGPDGTSIEAAPNPPADLNAPAPGGLVAGGRAIVTSQGDQLNIRTQPSTGPNSSVIASLTAGTSLQVLEGPTEAEGFTWWRVRTDTIEGWCVGDFLAAQAGP